MRVRRKKHTEARLAAHAELIVQSPTEYKNRWRELLSMPDDSPLLLEIGCGKGDFACAAAERYASGLVVAMEIVPDIIVTAVEKAAALPVTPQNLKFVIGDAMNLTDYFGADEVSEIFLNFSDPWKKRYQRSKRLTHIGFLEVYGKILRKGGFITFKTDNADLFDFSLKSFAKYGLETVYLIEDLHSEGNPEDNIMTEYEKAFVSEGCKIYKTKVRMK